MDHLQKFNAFKDGGEIIASITCDCLFFEYGCITPIFNHLLINEINIFRCIIHLIAVRWEHEPSDSVQITNKIMSLGKINL